MTTPLQWLEDADREGGIATAILDHGLAMPDTHEMHPLLLAAYEAVYEAAPAFEAALTELIDVWETLLENDPLAAE